MARVHVVLVRPENAANVGAVARVIRNTGLGALGLVSPGDWRTVECWRTAWGAHEILENAQVFECLETALAESSYVAGFSGKREAGAALLDVREVAAEVASLGEETVASLVFGPETSGLTRDELAACGRRVFIPSHSAQPSLNVSHAVMVAGYEVFRAGTPSAAAPRRATHDEKVHMLELLREGLLAVEAIPGENAGGRFREWRELFQRADLTSHEIRLLEHLARKMAKAGSLAKAGA